MGLTTGKKKALGQIKQYIKNFHVCPQCGRKIKVGIEFETLKKLHKSKYFLYPHLHLHGDSLHAMICYIDFDLNVRGVEIIDSVEISRDSKTFSQFMKKWSNPH